ncbi:hypothetical protein RI367_005415 [Sorochytrium milnesiophthora]
MSEIDNSTLASLVGGNFATPVLPFPMSDRSTLFRLCNTGDGTDCSVSQGAYACYALNNCMSSLCQQFSDGLHRSYCAATQCASAFTACYGARCLPWTDPLLAESSLTVNLAPDLGPAVQYFYPGGGPPKIAPSWIWGQKWLLDQWHATKNDSLAVRISVGLCVTSPPLGSTCSGTDRDKIDLSTDSGTMFSPMTPTVCRNGTRQQLQLPQATCDNAANPCMFGDCDSGTCNAAWLTSTIASATPTQNWGLPPPSDQSTGEGPPAEARRQQGVAAAAATAAGPDRVVDTEQVGDINQDDEDMLPVYKRGVSDGEVRLQYTEQAHDDLPLGAQPGGSSSSSSATLQPYRYHDEHSIEMHDLPSGQPPAP